MKRYYSFLLLVMMITLGNIAKAQCSYTDGVQGIRDYHFDFLIGQKMSTEDYFYEIVCTESVVLRFNNRVEDQFYNSLQTVFKEMRPMGQPQLKIVLDIKSLEVGSSYRYRKQWDFPIPRFFSWNGANVETIPEGRYEVKIQNHLPDYRLRDKPYFYPWPTISQVLFTMGNSGLVFSTTPRSGDDLCTSDSYQIKTLPGYNIDFGELDKKDLEQGRTFTQPFSIEVSRVPGDECYELVYPDIEFQTELVLDGATNIAMDNGLYLSLEDSNRQPVKFGERMTLGKLEAKGKRLATDFTGVIRKNPNKSVKTGEFSAIIRYIVHMR